MADQIIKYILEAVDNASAKFEAVGKNLRQNKSDLKDYGAALDSLIGGTALLAGAGALTVKSFADEEASITKAARATQNAAGGFDQAKSSITDLNKEMETQGFATEGTTQAVTLLVNKFGMDFPTALQKAGDLMAYAEANNLTLQRAVMRLADEEKGGIAVIEGANEARMKTLTTNDKMAIAQEKVNNLLEKIGESIAPAVIAGIDAIIPVVETMTKGAENLGLILGVIGQGWTNVNDLTRTAAATWDGTILGMQSTVSNFEVFVKGSVGNVLTSINKFVTDVGTSFAGLIKSGLQWGKDLIDNVIQGIQDKAKELTDRFSGAAEDIGQAISDFLTGGATGLAAKGVRPLAEGGVITSPTLAVLGEGGENEYVIPESKLAGIRGGGSPTFAVTINVAGNIDDRNREFVVNTVQQEFATLWRSVSRS